MFSGIETSFEPRVAKRIHCYSCSDTFHALIDPNNVQCPRCHQGFVEIRENLLNTNIRSSHQNRHEESKRTPSSAGHSQRIRIQLSAGPAVVSINTPTLNMGGIFGAIQSIFQPSIRPVPVHIAPLQFIALGPGLRQNESVRPPASKKAVSSLPILKIDEQHCKKASEGGLEPPSCTVCCGSIALGELGQLLPCGHIFHPPCLKPWLEKNNTCPVCRYELPTDDPYYETNRRTEEENAQARMHNQ